MSFAAHPNPRPSRPSSAGPAPSRPTSPRYNYFWPIQIYLIGALVLATYQVTSLETQLDQLTQDADHLDPAVKRAAFHKARFYALARGIRRLAPKDAGAQKVVEDTGMLRLQKTEPFLMSLDHPEDLHLPAVVFEASAPKPAATEGPVLPPPEAATR